MKRIWGIPLVAMSLFMASSCSGSLYPGEVIQTAGKNIVSVSVKEGSVPETIVEGTFDQAGIKLLVAYSNGDSEEVALTTEMVPEKYRPCLAKAGVYTIQALFRGNLVSLSVHIVKEAYAVNFYAYVSGPKYELVKSENVAYGGTATALDVATDLYDATNHYAFQGWNADYSKITQTLDVYALYRSINYYTVSFYNGNQELIKSEKVDLGDDATPPTKEESAMEGYRFVIWDKDYHNVQSNLNITGVYLKTSEVPEDAQHKDSGVMDKPVTIYFMSNFSYQSTIDKIIESFKTIEPNITVVNVKETGGYEDVKNKSLTLLGSGNHPDLFVGYTDSVNEFISAAAVVNLDDYMNHPVYGWSKDDKEDIIEAYLTEGQMYPLAGTYSVPFAKSTEALYYNKTVLIGLDLSAQDPTINGGKALSEDYLNDLTWEDLFGHLIPALQAYDNAQDAAHKILTGTWRDHHIFGYDSDDNLFITLAEQYGYGYTSIDEYGEGSLDFLNDGMKNLMKTFKRAYDGGGFFTKGTNNNEYTNYTFTESSCLFSVGSTGLSKYQISADFDTGVASIPHAEGRDPKVINQGPSLAILDHHDNDRALASWLFYRHLSNAKNTLTWAMETGYAPVRYSVLEDPEYQDFISEEGKTPRSEDQIKAAVAGYMGRVGPDMYSSPVFKGSAEARVQVGALFSNCLLDNDLNAHIDDIFQAAYERALKAL